MVLSEHAKSSCKHFVTQLGNMLSARRNWSLLFFQGLALSVWGVFVLAVP